MNKYVFDLTKIHPDFRIGKKPRIASKKIKLYKGMRRDALINNHIYSMALMNNRKEHIEEVKTIIESANREEIKKLFDRHTSHYDYTALISASPNYEIAQNFANHISNRENVETMICEIRIDSNRFVYDSFGFSNGGFRGEALILGEIYLDEIKRCILNYKS